MKTTQLASSYVPLSSCIYNNNNNGTYLDKYFLC